jgi:methionyl-tRNA formyltransferase
MRTILIGAVDSTRVALDTLGRHGAPPAALLTLPLSHARRHSDFVDLRPLARQLAVPVIETTNVNAPDTLQRLRDLAPTYALVIGWSQICRREFLAVPTAGAIGFHPALLPENRGRAVLPWTILQGRREAGATLFWLDEGTDSGDILAQERVPVAPDETAATLYARMGEALRRLLESVLPALAAGGAPRLPQDHTRATYCAKRTPADGLIDWRHDAHAVWTLIRAVGDPYPGAFTFLDGRSLHVWDAAFVGPAPYTGLPGQVQALRDGGALVQCGDGQHLLARTVQRAGEERRAAADVLKLHVRLGIDWGEVMRLLAEGRDR